MLAAALTRACRRVLPATRSAARTLARAASTRGSSGKNSDLGDFGSMAQPELHLFGLYANYANALFSVAAKQKQLEVVEKELLQLEDAIKTDKRFALFLKDPTIARSDKREDIASVMKAAEFSKPVAGLFEVLAENGRLADAPEVIKAFKKLMSAHRREVVARVTSADPLTEEQLEQVKQALKKRVGKDEKLLLKTDVDADILGGLKVQIGNYFIDLSLATKIDKIHALLETADT